MHRTKCTALVKKLLGPHFKAELCQDLQEAPFSLLVDESTDVSTIKNLGVSIKYYSASEKKIISTFLGLLEIADSDAIHLDGAVRQVIPKSSLIFGRHNMFFPAA